MRTRISAMVVAALLQPWILGAQPLPTGSADLSVPETPAFTVLGLTPQNVTRPASPRELVTSLLNGVDANGNLQTGLAIETSPYLLFKGKTLTLEDYKDSYALRLGSRTSLSLATTTGAESEDESTKAAVGLHLTLYDAGDPRLNKDLAECFSALFPSESGPGNAIPLENNAQEIAKREQQMKREWQDCRSAFTKNLWNKSSWGIGVATTWISEEGDADELKSDRRALWTSYAHGIGKHSQLIGHARYLENEEIPDPESSGAFLQQDSWFFGGRIRFGTADFNGSFESTYTRREPEGAESDKGMTLLLGLERKLASDLWLQLALGRETGFDRTENQMIVRSSFKYAFANGPSQ